MFSFGENEYSVPVGVYCSGVYTTAGNYANTISGVKIFKEITKPIDEKYLPMDAIREGVAPPAREGAATIEPETYYQFGEVESLAVTLVEKADNMAHEYLFEFIPAEGFEKPVITPEPMWLGDPQFPVGKKCVVSVCMGLAVTACG